MIKFVTIDKVQDTHYAYIVKGKAKLQDDKYNVAIDVSLKVWKKDVNEILDLLEIDITTAIKTMHLIETIDKYNMVHYFLFE